MKKLHLSLIFLCFSSFLFGQTLYVPGGSGSIQSNTSNIGIGTPDASSLLTLRTSGSSTDLEFKNAGTTRTWKYIMETSGKLRIWGSTAGHVTTIDPVSGNFGIKSDNPSKDLHVSDQGDYSGQLSPSNWQAGIGNYANNKGEVLIGTYDDRPALQGHGSGTGYHLLLNPFNGNVGIGTTNPGNRLHISNLSNDGINLDNKFRLRTSSTSNHFVLEHIADNGNIYIRSIESGDASGDILLNDLGGSVGIGTNTVGISGTGINDLVIGDGVGSRGLVVNANSSDDGILAFASDGTLAARWIYHNPTGVLNFYKPSIGNLFTIGSSGNIGIKTSEPTSFLDIHTTDGNSASGIVISQGNSSGNRHSGRIFFENRGEASNSFAILKSGDKLSFRTAATAGSSSGTEQMFLNSSGQIGIGTSSTGTHKLAVAGSIGAREIKVEAGSWSDFVFAKDYDLPTLEEVETHISKNGHLPAIPSEAEVLENGINLGEMDAKLLQKIEELTLYLIEQNKKNKEQQQLIEELQKEISELKSK